MIQLPLGQAIKRSGVSVDKWDLYRERRYIAPRYPYPREPFTEARFKAYIEIAPRQILHDEKVMEGVLPARYPVSPSSALSGCGADRPPPSVCVRSLTRRSHPPEERKVRIDWPRAVEAAEPHVAPLRKDVASPRKSRA